MYTVNNRCARSAGAIPCLEATNTRQKFHLAGGSLRRDNDWFNTRVSMQPRAESSVSLTGWGASSRSRLPLHPRGEHRAVKCRIALDDRRFPLDKRLAEALNKGLWLAFIRVTVNTHWGLERLLRGVVLRPSTSSQRHFSVHLYCNYDEYVHAGCLVAV